MQCLQRSVLRFLDVGTDFVVISCHFRCSSFWVLAVIKATLQPLSVSIG
ncbi:hypothetical protein H4V95_002273 [Arthrobacter sp. CAN_C5]|nr:hypothetical protein [Arthrobacter sp. CAN_C5]